MSDKKPSAETIKKLLRHLSTLVDITPDEPTKERYWIDKDEQGKETIKMKFKKTRKKQIVSDADLLKLIIECLKQDKFFIKKSGRIVITRISKHLSKIYDDGRTNEDNMERNFRIRTKELLPEIIGVIKYNGKFYYKKSKFYNPPTD